IEHEHTGEPDLLRPAGSLQRGLGVVTKLRQRRGDVHAASNVRISSSVVWAKSSYQNPTAPNGSGAMTHTTSSARRARSSRTGGAAVGTPTTTISGAIDRSAATAARMVAPVARPS